MPSTSTYMLLTIPTVGVDTGPIYATYIDAALVIIDAHNHDQTATGQGRPINQNGILLTGDLSMNSQNLIAIAALKINNNGGTLAATVVRALYVNGSDLYFNDGSGNAVRITAAGAVNTGGTGSISGMDATSAVTYSTGTKVYTFTQSAGFPAKIAVGDIQIYETTSGAANALTLKVPAGFSSAYSLTLPAALPATSAVNITSSAGVMSFVTAPATNDGLLKSTAAGVNSYISPPASGFSVLAMTSTGTMTAVRRAPLPQPFYWN